MLWLAYCKYTIVITYYYYFCSCYSSVNTLLLPLLLLLSVKFTLFLFGMLENICFSPVFHNLLDLHILVQILIKTHTIYSKHKTIYNLKHLRRLLIQCSFILSLNYVHSYHSPSVDHSGQIIYKKEQGFICFSFYPSVLHY